MTSQDYDLDFDLLDEAIIEEKNDKIEKEKEQLSAKYQDMLNKNIVLEKQNKILKANISSLFKTASSEIDRKNNQINQLRSQLDDLILRRHFRHQEKQQDRQQERQPDAKKDENLEIQEQSHRNNNSNQSDKERQVNRDPSVKNYKGSSNDRSPPKKRYRSRSRSQKRHDRHRYRH